MLNFAAQMKVTKHISLLIAFLILFSNAGLAVNVHYCHGEVSSVSFAYKLNEPCGGEHHKKEAKSCCPDQGNHEKCCDNDLVKLQDVTDDSIIKSAQLDLGAFCAVNEWKPVQFYGAPAVLAKDTPSFYCAAHAPPLFKLYCQYIFYA